VHGESLKPLQTNTDAGNISRMIQVSKINRIECRLDIMRDSENSYGGTYAGLESVR